MRMAEDPTGCRVLGYCIMSNHFSILGEVPPKSDGWQPDALLFDRMRALYSKGRVAAVERELADLRERRNRKAEEALREW